MNIQAANALLKVLEEPTIDTLFILVTDRPSLLPATIRSRCQKIVLRTRSDVSPQLALKTVILNDLTALCSTTMREGLHPVAVAERWLKQSNPKELLCCLFMISNEQAKLNMRQNRRFWDFFDALLSAHRALDEANPPNVHLLLESLLIQYIEAQVVKIHSKVS